MEIMDKEESFEYGGEKPDGPAPMSDGPPPRSEDGHGPQEDFSEDNFEDYGPWGGGGGDDFEFGPGPGPNWRGGRGGPPRGRFMRGNRGGFGPPPRGRFPPPRGGPPNGFGPPRGRGGFGPRGPPPPGWGDPNFGPPGPGMGPPPGMMPPWGMGHPNNGPPPGWHEDGPPGPGGPGGPGPGGEGNGGIDLSGEVWVETKADDNKCYYYNARTRETTWTKPEGEGVKVLTQEQVDQLTQQMGNEPGQGGPDHEGYGMPPPGFHPPGGFGPGGGPPGAQQPPYGGGPPGFPPPWGMAPPPWAGAAACPWSEHVAPDGKKYYYNSKSGESVWEKPKELADFERQQATESAPPVMASSAGVTTSTSNVIPPIANGSKSSTTTAEPKPMPKPEDVAAKLNPKAEKPTKPQDKSRPVSSTPVSGTPWCVVWTGDNRAFFYNPTTKTSVWDRPPELVGRPDVTEMLKSPAAAEKQKGKSGSKKNKKDSDDSGTDDEQPPAKVKKVETELVFEDELKKKQENADEANNGQDAKKSIDVGKNAAMEAEVRAAKERANIPLETRMKQFRDLLAEKEISAFSTWEKELHKIVFDPRYLLLTSKERKQVFDKYVRERADEERREKKNRIKERKEAFRKLLQEAKLSSKSSFSDFATKYGKDDRFRNVEKMRERESIFNEYVIEVRKKEKEEKAERKEKAKKDFFDLLKETSCIDRHSYWSDVKKVIDADPRYKAVDSSSQREDWFLDHVHALKDEHKRNKKKKHKSRSRSRERKSSKRSRSRSRSRSRERKKDKKDKEERKKDKKKDKEKARSEERDEEVKEKIKMKKDDEEKEEGEMSDDERDEEGRSRHNSEEERKVKKEEEEENLSDGERERREKEERIAASIRKREEEVQRELSGHLHARDKEREQHRHKEAISNFQALLVDLIKQPDYTWKEAKKVLKKDSRYESVSALEKSEREMLFDDHIDMLIAKKKENYWKLLDECKEIKLDSSFKEIKKLIRDDPRYSKYSSSDRKCEKQFNEYLKDKMSRAKGAFRELLQETKKITDKSLALIKDKDSGHMQEIEELLLKDKRYLDLECVEDVRKDILMMYLEEMERRGPPPPPTASEPGRRGAK